MAQLWSEGLLCDAMVIVEGRHFIYAAQRPGERFSLLLFLEQFVAPRTPAYAVTQYGVRGAATTFHRKI